MARKLVWKNETAFHGWGCTDCGFVLSNPRPLNSLKDYAKTARAKFGQHKCAEHPRIVKVPTETLPKAHFDRSGSEY